jgi:hypothetical protein
LVLRFRDPFTPRPYLMPFNVGIRYRGRQVRFPVLAVIGMVSMLFFLIMVVATHAYARVAGPVWIVFAFLFYVVYRRRRQLPALGTVRRDWDSITREVLRSAQEWQSLEEFDAAVVERGSRLSK